MNGFYILLIPLIYLMLMMLTIIIPSCITKHTRKSKNNSKVNNSIRDCFVIKDSDKSIDDVMNKVRKYK